MITTSGIKPHETQIIGRWVVQDGHPVGDESCQRIEYLTRRFLKGVDISADGWDLLYQDRTDGRYWELTYQMTGAPGGGPPSLIALNPEQAGRKYRLKCNSAIAVQPAS